MNNEILLAVGVITILLGIYFLLREEKTKLTHDDAEQIFSIVNSFESKVQFSLQAIDEKTSDSLNKIQTAQKKIAESTKEERKTFQESAKPLSKIKLKHKEVYTLYSQGLSSKEIASKLNKGVGEIETIVSLFKLERD